MLHLLTALALAAPTFIPVQGALTDTSGAPIDGVRSVEFALYESDSAPTAAWTATTAVTFAAGAFSAELAGGAPTLDTELFADHPELWLSVRLEGDPASGRVRLGRAAFAAWADRAGTPTPSGARRRRPTATPPPARCCSARAA